MAIASFGSVSTEANFCSPVGNRDRVAVGIKVLNKARLRDSDVVIVVELNVETPSFSQSSVVNKFIGSVWTNNH